MKELKYLKASNQESTPHTIASLLKTGGWGTDGVKTSGWGWDFKHSTILQYSKIPPPHGLAFFFFLITLDPGVCPNSILAVMFKKKKHLGYCL